MKILILVDLEKEWINKDSEYYLGGISNLIQKTNILIKYARENNYKIIFIKHIEKSGENAFLENSKGVEFFDEIDIQGNDIIIEKNKISAFYNTNLEKEIIGNDLIISGILTNLCVRSLVNDAYDRDYNIELIEDCCIAFDEETHNFTLKDIKETRTEIKILKLNEFLKK